MRFKTSLVTAVLLLSVAYCQTGKYTKAMEKNLSLMDSASTPLQFAALSNSFERIAIAEKDKWLPYYYAGYCLIISSFIDTSVQRKDTYLDQAEKFVLAADSLEPENSEICTVSGMLAQARMAVDPMSRWQKYGQLSNNLFDKAKKLDPTNPRPDALIGNTIYYTPEAFGGGKKNAEPVLKTALEKFQKFVQQTSISPKWGQQIVEDLLKNIQ